MIRIPVREEADVAVARARVRELATREGLAPARAAALAIAVSELAWNIVHHAGWGEVELSAVAEGGRRGLTAVARDPHPGIADVEAALRDGHSTRGGLGLGLSSARRLCDRFAIESAPGRGTTVTVTQWAADADP